MADDPLEELMFGGARPPVPPLASEGFKRYLQVGVRGATLGMAGTQIPAQNLGESVTEMAGSLPTIAGVSAVASPVGALAARTVPILRAPSVLPTASRMVTSLGTGAIVGGTEALVAGENPLKGAATGAAQFGVLEAGFLGAQRMLGKALKAPPVGKTLTPSPAENPVAAEVNLGQGRPPEHPPNLSLPVVRSSGVFEAKDFVGSGTVLNPERNPQLRQARILRPEEQTRRMLPEGRLPEPAEPLKALPPASGKPEGHIAAPETEYPWEPFFAREMDPKMGEVLVPKTPEVGEAAEISLGVDPRAQGELPLSHAQLHYVEEVKPDLMAKMDTISKREPSLTDNLLKQPAEVVEEATQRASAPPIEAHSIELTPAGLEARQLITRSGIDEAEYVKFGSTLRGTRDQKLNQLLGWLREKCK